MPSTLLVRHGPAPKSQTLFAQFVMVVEVVVVVVLETVVLVVFNGVVVVVVVIKWHT